MSEKKTEKDQEWVGFDLDGTLARYDKWTGFAYIGDPVPKMIDVCRAHIERGDRVKIFTARASGLNATEAQMKQSNEAIEAWCIKHLGKKLEITAEKDYLLKLFYDDRAISVDFNIGSILSNFEKVLDNTESSEYSANKE